MADNKNENRDLSIAVCVAALKSIHEHSLKHAHSVQTSNLRSVASVTVDMCTLLKWYEDLDDRTRASIYSDDCVLRAAMGYEHKCLDICSFTYRE